MTQGFFGHGQGDNHNIQGDEWKSPKTVMFSLRQNRTVEPDMLPALLAGLMANFAYEMGVDPRAVFAIDMRSKSPRNPLHVAAGQVRCRAIYLAHCGLGISGSRIARALGQTKQSVSLAIKSVENARGRVYRPEHARIIGRIENLYGVNS